MEPELCSAHFGRRWPVPSSRKERTLDTCQDNVALGKYQVNMAISTPALYIPGKVEGHVMHFLLDSGCTLNLLSKRMLERLPARVTNDLQPFEHSAGTLADGSDLLFLGQVEVNGRVRSESVQLSFVVADITPDAILGMPFLRDHKCNLRCNEFTLDMNGKSLRCTDSHGVDFATKVQVIKTVSIPAHSEQIVECRLTNKICKSIGMVEHNAAVHSGVTLAPSIHACDTDKVVVRCLNPTDKQTTVSSGTVVGQCTGIDIVQVLEDTGLQLEKPGMISSSCNTVNTSATVPEHLQSLYQEAITECAEVQQQYRIASLLSNYGDVFSEGDHDQGLTNLVKHSIEIEPGARPVKQAPRRLGAEREAEVDRQIIKLQDQGVIEPASGAWSSPVVLVKKKDGSWRFCVNYRRLNLVTVHDAHPLPRIDESLEALAGSKYFTTLDLMSGYWQVPLDEDAKDKSAFCTRGGLWRWRVLPFGLTAAPATFQRLMERVLHGMHWKSLLLYLDDIIVIGNDFDNHFSRLEEVLQRFRAANLKLKPSKCHLFQTKVDYLGHVVSKHGVATDPTKVNAVANWPVPKNLSELRAFLGTVGYYRQYVDGFASTARPLTKLTGKDTKFQWSEECQVAFNSLKQALISAPVLGYPDPALEYILDTDASLEGIGAVLSQVQGGKERVISYYSRALDKSERNYCVTRRELLAVVMAVAHYRPYLYGKKFLIRTDHASLLWLCRRTTPTHQVARWLETLAEFNFVIRHRPGSKHGNADGLSRRPCHDCRQCDRLLRSCGGPTIDKICEELKSKAEVESPVETHVVGDQLGEADHGVIHAETKSCLDKKVVSCDNSQLICPVSSADDEDSQSTQGSDSNAQFNIGCSPDVLRQVQEESGDVATILKAVEAQQEPDQSIVNLGSSELKRLCAMFSLLRIREDGLLVARVLIGQRTHEVVICPRSLRRDTVWKTHTLAHAGMWKTLRRLRLIWYWPGMSADVRRIIKTCETCQKAKSGGVKASTSQGPLWVGRPWQKVAIDLVGPLPLTPRGNQWVLVLTDHFTRWQDALALPDATAPTVAETLDNRVFSYFGLPEEIHSDRGAQFEGDLMTELCKFWRITKTRTTPYHPQSNGVVERGNRMLGDALRAMLLSYAQAQDSWDTLLPQLMRAFRATPHSVTEETANYLMLGRECRLPDQLAYGTHSIELSDRARFALELKERLESAYDLLREQQVLPLRSAESEDETLFKEGDLVLVTQKRRRKGINPKLQPKFDGPFVVQRSFNNGTYKLEGKGVINECRLKLFTPCPDRDGQLVEPSRRAVDSQDCDNDQDNVDEQPLVSDHTTDCPDPVVHWNPQPDPPSDSSPDLPPGRFQRARRQPMRLKDYVVY